MAAAAPASAAKDKDVKQPAGAAGAGAGAGLSTDAAGAAGKGDAAVVTTRAPIAARFALLCGKSELSDVTFVVGKNGEAKIPAHRFILAARSPIFEALLYHPVRPHLKLSKPIVIKDVEPDAFMCMLRCIYSDKPGLNHENILGASRCAKKYQVESLRVACVQFSKKGITAATACGLYDRSPELALEFIEQNASKVFASAGFRALSERSVIGLLRSNKLDITEPKLFKHVLAWGKAECERRGLDAEKAEVLREVMKNVILGVRFPLFSTAQLSTHVTKLNLLTPDQLLGVFSVVGGNKTAKCAFSLIPRESALMRFAFDQNKKSPSVTLHTNDTVARLNAKCGYVLGARAVKRGVTAWRLTFAMNAANNIFNAFAGGGGVPQVTYGISAPKAYFDQRSSFSDATVYAIDTINQWFSGGAAQGTQYVTGAVGQSVDVVLDLTARTLSYVNVQTKQRHLIQNIAHSDEGYVLHVHMIRNGSQVTVQTIRPAQAGN